MELQGETCKLTNVTGQPEVVILNASDFGSVRNQI